MAIEAFRNSHAISPSSARPLAELDVQDDRAFRRLKDRVVIREGSPGRYYLDEEVWASVHRERHRFAARLVLALLAVAVTMAILTLARIRGH